MEKLLKTVGGIAGIGGIGLAIVLLIYRDIIREFIGKNLFPQLSTIQTTGLIGGIIVLTFSLAIISIYVQFFKDTDSASKSPTSLILLIGIILVFILTVFKLSLEHLNNQDPSPVEPFPTPTIEPTVTQTLTPIPTTPTPISTPTPTPTPDELFPGTQEDTLKLDYSRLESSLKSDQWKRADEETYSLIYKTLYFMEQGGIERFPCDIFFRIDDLWVDYSSGKFGFSTQVKIWKDLGRPAVTDQYGNSAIKLAPNFNKFADRVGWRENNTYLDYDSLTFSNAAPEGHLPGLGMQLGEYVCQQTIGIRVNNCAKVTVLFRNFDECKTSPV